MRRGVVGDVHFHGPVVAIDGIGAVGHFKLEGLDLLEELVLLVDDLEIQTIAIHGGHPGQEEAKKNHPGLVFNLSWAKLVKGEELHGISPSKGLNRLP